ncbi:hypothetical protein AAG906_016958 [Vitis piasezkii]
MEGGLLAQLASRPISQLLPPCFRMDLHSKCNHEPSTGSLYACNFIEDDNIHMMSWDDGLSEPILTPTAPLATTHQDPPVPFILRPDDDGSEGRDIRVETTTTPKGLIHMMTADKATCIVFSNDDLPPEGSNHTRPLYITFGCSGHRVPSILLDNGSALNVFPLATAIALGYALSDFGPSHRQSKHMIVLRGRSWVL